MGHAWDTHGTRMGHAWGVHGARMAAWDKRMGRPIYTAHLHGMGRALDVPCPPSGCACRVASADNRPPANPALHELTHARVHRYTDIPNDTIAIPMRVHRFIAAYPSLSLHIPHASRDLPVANAMMAWHKNTYGEALSHCSKGGLATAGPGRGLLPSEPALARQLPHH